MRAVDERAICPQCGIETGQHGHDPTVCLAELFAIWLPKIHRALVELKQ
jgi:hypothetical protein